jgi:hypothetical protein
MNRPNTRSGLFSAIGAASSYKDQYYYGTDTGIYYYSNGTVWNTSNFDSSNTINNLSGTVAVGGTAQVIAVANPARKWLYFQNNGNTANMYIGLGYVPTATNGILVVKDGGYVRFDSYVPTDAVYAFCTHTHTYSCLEGL